MTSPSKKCAIYTRKSSEEGLEQDFNSLDAQREACAAFITSQKAEGWVAIKEHYDDGGFSGGNTERPGLQRLLHDTEACAGGGAEQTRSAYGYIEAVKQTGAAFEREIQSTIGPVSATSIIEKSFLLKYPELMCFYFLSDHTTILKLIYRDELLFIFFYYTYMRHKSYVSLC